MLAANAPISAWEDWGNTELALMEIDKDHPLVRPLDEISKSVDSASALTRQLLAFSRKQIIKPRVIDLNELLQRLRLIVERLLSEDIEVRWSLLGIVVR